MDMQTTLPAGQIPVTRTKKRVLVADDDERIVRFVRLRLMASGYEVVTAMTGQCAMSAIESEHPDIVVLDLRMPGMDGLQVLERLRGRFRLPVIVISASDKASEALALGADLYLPKPIDLGALLGQIKALLSDAAGS